MSSAYSYIIMHIDQRLRSIICIYSELSKYLNITFDRLSRVYSVGIVYLLLSGLYAF